MCSPRLSAMPPRQNAASAGDDGPEEMTQDLHAMSLLKVGRGTVEGYRVARRKLRGPPVTGFSYAGCAKICCQIDTRNIAPPPWDPGSKTNDSDGPPSRSAASSSTRLQPLPARRQSVSLRIRRSGTGPTAIVERDNSCDHCQSGRSLPPKTITRRTSCSQPRRPGRGTMPWSFRESNRSLQVDTGATSPGPPR